MYPGSSSARTLGTSKLETSEARKSRARLGIANLGSRNWSLNSFRFHVAFLKPDSLKSHTDDHISRILRHENFRMPDAMRPVRERGKFLYDHPANEIGGGRRGDTPGSTVG